jgi:hypothetical protein
MKKVVISLLLIGLISCCVYAFTLWNNYIKVPFDEFERDANLAIPLLEQMDDTTLSQFPVPTQASKKKTSYSNANTAKAHNYPYPRYGNELSVMYNYSGSKEDIIEHYKQILIQDGWDKQETASQATSLYYRKGTACFRLSIDSETYTIDIRHDFWKQDFSPKPLPNFPGTDLTIWDVMLLGEAAVYTCP